MRNEAAMSVRTISTVELYRRCATEFATLVGLVGDRWAAPTPCEGWDVRALLWHIVEEDRWTPPLLAGLTVAQVGDRISGDPGDADPVAAFGAAAALAMTAVQGDGAMERTVHLSFGDVPGREYALQLAADHLVHAWDLSCALGLDVRLDPEAVAAVHTWFGPNEDAYRQAGLIGPRGSLPDRGGPQEELLTMFGRNP
jgi:uncharacterized protein (TIGR03086 family)